MKTFIIKEEDCVRTEEGWELDVRVVIVPEEVEPPVEPPIEPPIEPPVEGDVLHVNFADVPKGRLSESDIKELFGAPGGVRMSSEFAVVDDPANSGRGNVMSVFFPKGKGSGQSGGQWTVPIPGMDKYFFSHDIFVPEGFNWPLSNKLSGLFGGKLSAATGGEEEYGIEGWSMRQGVQSERKSGDTAGYVGIGDGVIGTKLGGYKPQQKPARSNTRMVAGRWLRLEQGIDIANGTYTQWANGARIYKRTGVQYSKGGDLDIDGLSCVFWYGGGGPAWVSREDQWWFYDNFVVSTQPISH